MPTSRHRFDHPPAAVYTALLDAPRYPLWLIGAKRVVEVDDDWPVPGSSFIHHTGVGPAETRDRTTVREAREDDLFVLHVRARPFIEAEVRFDMVPDGAGTRLRLDERPEGKFRPVGWVLGPLLWWRNNRSLARLEQLLDSGS